MDRLYRLSVVIAFLCLTSQIYARSYLIDFGTSASYRGVSVSNPDVNGRYWNGIKPGDYLSLVDSANTSSTIYFGFNINSTMLTDSYNGPAGAFATTPTATEIANAKIDATALGTLGINEAALDYVSSVDGRFDLGGLNANTSYNLTFFGSHKYSADAITVYEAFSDATYSTVVKSANLNIQSSTTSSLHNSNQLATLTGLVPTGGKLYLRFRGLSGTNNGYLNSMQIAESIATGPVDGVDVSFLRIRNPSSGLILTRGSAATPQMTASTLDSDQLSHWYLLGSTSTSQVFIRNRLTGEVLRAAADTGSISLAAFDPNDPRQLWTLTTVSNITRITLDTPNTTLTANTAGNTPTVSTQDLTSAQQTWTLDALPHGAGLPWTSYDEDNTKTLSGSVTQVSSSYEQGSVSVASEAQKRACLSLDATGSAIQWQLSSTANVLNLRYSVTDGQNGTITLKITPQTGSPYTTKVSVTSALAWVYFDSQANEYDAQAADGSLQPYKRFNDVRIKLPSTYQAGDLLEIRRDSGDNVQTWIDVVEAETSTASPPSDLSFYLNAKTGYGAKGDGVTDDTTALKTCITAAVAANKGIYLPAGTYKVSTSLSLPTGTTIQGDGMWWTEIFFSSPAKGGGGFVSNGSNTKVRDLYVRGSQTSRSAGGYSAFGGWWGSGSFIENVWAEQTDTGAWIGDYTSSAKLTDGLMIRNCRFRNTFADGVNCAQGTLNTVVENCHIRGVGDDGLASWSSGFNTGYPMCRNQQFRYNTIECVYRAGGIGFFGGQGHKAHHNLIRDQVAGPGIRLNTVFMYSGTTQIGHGFGTERIKIYDNTLRRTGNLGLYGETPGAVELETWYNDVQNIDFWNINIDTTRYQGLGFNRLGAVGGAEFLNLTFSNFTFSGAPVGTKIFATCTGSATLDSTLSTAGIINLSANFIVTGPPPPPPSIISFTPSTVAPGDLVTLTGTTLAGTTSVSFGNVFAESFTVNSDTSVTAVVPTLAVDNPISITTRSGTATSLSTLTVLHPNTAPMISLAIPSSISIPQGVGVLLQASVTDDGLPLPMNLTSSWSVVSFPANSTVTFDNPASATTGATFSTSGLYTLRVTSSDGALSNSTDISISHGTLAAQIAQDIGSVAANGSSTESSGLWTIRGSGADIWNTTDGFFFRGAELTGNGSIQARLTSQTATDQWAKAGIMIRSSTTANSTHALLAATPANGLAFQRRTTTGGTSTHTALGSFTYPIWLKLTRNGSTLTGYKSSNGTKWTQAGTTTISMSDPVLIGLAVTSHNNGVLGTAVFDNVQANGLGNQAPIVNAGSDQSALSKQALSLTGVANNATSTQWTQIMGPSILAFTSPGNLTSSITPSSFGTYKVRLLASNGTIQTFDDLNLTVTPSTSLETWQSTQFPTDPTGVASQPLADPDGDGWCNLLEFAQGGNPNNSDNMTKGIQSSNGTSGPLFSFRRRTGSGTGSTESGYTVDGITYTLKASPTLSSANWQSGSSVIQQVGTPVNNGDGTETVTVRILGSNQTSFIKMEVSLP